MLISIHAPRVGSDLENGHQKRGGKGFQSTLPVWGATKPEFREGYDYDISIHAPRVGSDAVQQVGQQTLERISIHAPRVGSDTFQRYQNSRIRISIHAPRVGSDSRNA